MEEEPVDLKTYQQKLFNEKNKEKKMVEKNEQNLVNLWDDIKLQIWVIRLPEGEETESQAETYLQNY